MEIKPLDADEEENILRLCPGAVVHGAIAEPGANDHPIVGPWIRVVKGHSSDAFVRKWAAAAGGMTAVSMWLLATKRVAFVCHVHARKYYNLKEYIGTKFSSTPEEVLEGSGSRYHPSAPMLGIPEALAREQPFAFLGKPCDVNALRALARIDPRVDRFCICMVCVCCGSFADPDVLDRFTAKHNIAVDDIAQFRWRGNGCPGDGSPFVEAKDGRVAKMDYVDFWYSGGGGGDVGPLTYQWRCKMCPDFWGHEADLTVMDTWPNALPEHGERITEARRHEQDGYVAMVARTQRGLQVLDGALADDALVQVGEDWQPEDLLFVQSHQVRKTCGLLPKRRAQAVSYELDAAATARMARCSLDASMLDTALRTRTGKAPPDKMGELSANLEGAARDAVDALPLEHQGFLEINYTGTKARLARGDADEPYLTA